MVSGVQKCLPELLTGTPLTMFTTTSWAGLPSLNLIEPLSSGASPLTVKGSAPAFATPMLASANDTFALSPMSWSSCAEPVAPNVLPAASLTDSVAVTKPSVIPDRLTELLTGTPLTMFTTTSWAGLPSLNLIEPLSSGASPLTVKGSAPAFATPMLASANDTFALSPMSWSSCAEAGAPNVLPAASPTDTVTVTKPSVIPDRL